MWLLRHQCKETAGHKDRSATGYCTAERMSTSMSSEKLIGKHSLHRCYYPVSDSSHSQVEWHSDAGRTA
eukprot:scaffold1298_cov333-Pavlova_lutheri.AAC.8